MYLFHNLQGRQKMCALIFIVFLGIQEKNMAASMLGVKRRAHSTQNDG